MNPAGSRPASPLHFAENHGFCYGQPHGTSFAIASGSEGRRGVLLNLCGGFWDECTRRFSAPTWRLKMALGSRSKRAIVSALGGNDRRTLRRWLFIWMALVAMGWF